MSAAPAGLVNEILLPRTDAGVAVQLAVIVPALGAAVWFVRRDRELRLFAIGVLVFVAALMALRTLH